MAGNILSLWIFLLCKRTRAVQSTFGFIFTFPPFIASESHSRAQYHLLRHEEKPGWIVGAPWDSPKNAASPSDEEEEKAKLIPDNSGTDIWTQPKQKSKLKSVSSSLVSEETLSGATARTERERGDEVGLLNDIFVLWVPDNNASRKRILKSICPSWPHELRSKIKLIDGVNAINFGKNMSKLFQTQLAKDIFGGSVLKQEEQANHIFVTGATPVAATAVNFVHYSAWKKILDGPDTGWTIVLEDDADLRSDARSLATLEELLRRHKSNAYTEPTLLMLDWRLAFGAGICKNCPNGCGCGAYAVDKRAADHLLRHSNLSRVIDMFLYENIKMVCPSEQTPFVQLDAPSITMSVSNLREPEAKRQTEVDEKVCKSL